MQHIMDLFEDNARKGNGHFAVAFAILQLAEQHKRVVTMLDYLGTNSTKPTAGPGVLEAIGMQISNVSDSLDNVASAITEISSSIDKHE